MADFYMNTINLFIRNKNIYLAFFSPLQKGLRVTFAFFRAYTKYSIVFVGRKNLYLSYHYIISHMILNGTFSGNWHPFIVVNIIRNGENNVFPPKLEPVMKAYFIIFPQKIT